MAGGTGSRFWPLSRQFRPKQLLPFGSSDESLLQASVRRLTPLLPRERIIIVTSRILKDAVRRQLPQIPEEHILAEPVGRNTAPCIGWGASHIERLDPEALIAVLPADQHIADEALFVATLKQALSAARANHMVTVGIRPTSPETGYGYMEMDQEIAPGLFAVRRFVEKPDLRTAEEYLASGRFLWNSGMFFFRADTMKAAIRTHLPDLSTALSKYSEAAKQGQEMTLINHTYPALQNISIDHGVMEKVDNLVVIPGNFGWSDMGHFASAWELAEKDAGGNAAPPDAVLLNAHRCYVKAPKDKLVALLGVQDLIVVDSGDALLIMPRHHAQDVRHIVQELQKPQYKKYT
ncbi:MAG: mannose-1-phosphate guanylyltransferase [Myxococcales bacterium]|nr:mannose-1-phosphate guanylyltransferase [Myxococcales bacterium]